MKSPLQLKNRKTQKKKKWRSQSQLTQENGPFPCFLERLLVLVLASCLRRWMATVDASDRSMPPYSLDFHFLKYHFPFEQTLEIHMKHPYQPQNFPSPPSSPLSMLFISFYNLGKKHSFLSNLSDAMKRFFQCEIGLDERFLHYIFFYCGIIIALCSLYWAGCIELSLSFFECSILFDLTYDLTRFWWN